MIHSFTVTNHLGESLVLTLADPDSSGLAIESVTGLGQVQADVNLTKLAGSDYSIANSANLTTRNIVFKFRYWGDNVESIRHKCDRFFPTKKEITLVAKTDERELSIKGIVEKNEPNIFNKDSGCQVSILCPDPFWYSTSDTVTSFSGISPTFEFPFCSSTEDDNPDELDTIEFGEIREVKNKSVYYTGESETGVSISFYATGIVRGLVFYDLTTNQKFGIDDTIIERITTVYDENGNVTRQGSSIQQGDQIIVSTIKTKKFATLIRSGVSYNIINALGRKKEWFELISGDNIFTYSATEGEYNLTVEMRNRVLFEGL